MKKTKVLVIINIICMMIFYINPSKIYAASQRIDNQISKIDDKKYPGIKSMIEKLQKDHPSWKFKILYTGLDWNTAIKEEAKHGRNLIGVNQKNYTGDWLCEDCEDNKKTYSGGNWVCVSNEAIAYMMDPRNSLYYEDVFQFLELSYDSTVTYDSNMIKNILKNTFLDDGNLDTYIATILNRSKEKNVNPYYIAGKIIQEQGTKGGATFKMKYTENDKTTYYYNIFNINATGGTTSAIVSNALSWAKDKGWDTIEKCLVGGVDFIANGYITIGQDTMYFEKFDVIADTYYTHQYAQDVMYAQNQGEKLRNILERINATEYEYTFVIPLYENTPGTACKRPATTRTNTANNVSNNNQTNNSSNGNVENPNNTNSDSTNNNNSNNNGEINSSADNTTTTTKYMLGDPNNDGKINSGDLFFIKQYLLKIKKIEDENIINAMDINKDKKINSGDLLLVKKHLLGTYKITQ